MNNSLKFSTALCGFLLLALTNQVQAKEISGTDLGIGVVSGLAGRAAAHVCYKNTPLDTTGSAAVGVATMALAMGVGASGSSDGSVMALAAIAIALVSYLLFPAEEKKEKKDIKKVQEFVSERDPKIDPFRYY